MDINSSYFKRIVYKKNAIDELSSYIKFYHKHKKILYLSICNNDLSNNILSQVASSGNAFRFCQINGKLKANEIKTLLGKAKESKLIIGYVDSESSNLVKYIASKFNCEYILVPCAPTSTLYFLPYFFSPINPLVTKGCDLPTRVFIDEKAILNCSQDEAMLGLNTLNAYYELYFTKLCECEIRNKDFDCYKISKILSRFNDLCNMIKKKANDAKLVLMDNLIELAEITKHIKLSEISFFNLARLFMQNDFLEKSNTKFEEYLCVASDIMFCCYRQLLLQKEIKQIALPDYKEVAILLKKYSIEGDELKGTRFFEAIMNDKTIFDGINNNKLKLLGSIDKILSVFKENIYLLQKYKKTKQISLPSLQSCYDSVKVLPFIFKNNLVVDLMCGTGIVNF